MNMEAPEHLLRRLVAKLTLSASPPVPAQALRKLWPQACTTQKPS